MDIIEENTLNINTHIEKPINFKKDYPKHIFKYVEILIFDENGKRLKDYDNTYSSDGFVYFKDTNLDESNLSTNIDLPTQEFHLEQNGVKDGRIKCKIYYIFENKYGEVIKVESKEATYIIPKSKD